MLGERKKQLRLSDAVLQLSNLTNTCRANRKAERTENYRGQRRDDGYWGAIWTLLSDGRAGAGR